MEEKQRNTTRKSIFGKLSEKIFALLKNGMFGYFFTSYDEANERYLKAVKRKRKVHSNKARRKISKTIEGSFFVNVIPKLVEHLLTTSTRDYGIAFLIMGAITTILYPLREQILFISITYATFLAGIVICLCAIPLLISSKSLATNLYNSKICKIVLFGFLGFDEEEMRSTSEKNRHSSTNIALLMGLILGLLSYFLEPTRVIIALVVMVLGYSALKTPEIGVVAIICAIPFFSIKLLCVATAYVFACYLIKWTIGKRTLKFEYLDVFVVATMALILIRGLISKNIQVTFKGALLSASLMLAYFLISNLIRSKEWFRRCMAGLVVSCTITSIVGISQMIIGRLSAYVPELSKIFERGQSVYSTFGDPTVFAQFLVALIPFVLVRMISKRNGMGKFMSFLFFVLVFVVICLTSSLPAVIGASAAILLLLIIYHRNYSYLAVILLIALPILYISLPDDIMARLESLKIFASFDVPAFVAEIRHAFQYFIQNPIAIFGTGKGIMESQSNYNYTNNLFLQVLYEQGIIVFIAIITLVVMISRMVLSYCAKAKNKFRRVNGCAGVCSIFGIIISGCLTYAFYDERLYLLLWVIVGISLSYMRIEREEEDPQINKANFTSATLEITLTGESEGESIPKRKYVRLPKFKKAEKIDEIKDFGDFEEVDDEEEEEDENEETKF